jgi:hypothetical protein
MRPKKNRSRIFLDLTPETVFGQKTLFEAAQIPEHELWLYEPKNREFVEEIREALQEKATIDLGSFKKFIDGNETC